MRKQSLNFMTVFLVIFSGHCLASLSGSGTELDPYLIQNRTDFDEWKSNQTYRDIYKHTQLTTDIDFADETFNYNVISSLYKGHFDGQGHKMLNLNITSGGGFFSYIEGTVENLSIINCNVSSTSVTVGGLCGKIEATGVVSNCYFEGSVQSTEHYVGGIAGWNSGQITNSSVNADIHGGGNFSSTGVFVGGNYGQITNCYATGQATANTWLGGFAGYQNNTGTITNCYSNAQVIIASGGTGTQVDGFVGKPDTNGTIQNCFLDTTTSAQTTTNTGVTELTATQMMNQANFTTAGWDFTTIWTMPTTGLGPLFQWQNDGTYCLTPPWFDYTNDCLVNIADFAAFAAAWLDCGYADQTLCP